MDAEGVVDAPSDAASEGGALVCVEWFEECGGGVDPEAAVELPVGRGEGVGDRVEGAADVGVRSEDVLRALDERVEEAVTCFEVLAQERFADGVGFVGVVEVPDDAEEVAGIGALGECAAPLLGLVGGDAVDDGVTGIPSDDVSDVALGVDELEAREDLVEVCADGGVEPFGARTSRTLELLDALLESTPSRCDLRIGGALRV